MKEKQGDVTFLSRRKVETLHIDRQNVPAAGLQRGDSRSCVSWVASP